MEGGRKINRTNFQKLDIEVEALQMKKQSPNPQGKAKTNSFKYLCTAKKKNSSQAFSNLVACFKQQV